MYVCACVCLYIFLDSFCDNLEISDKKEEFPHAHDVRFLQHAIESSVFPTDIRLFAVELVDGVQVSFASFHQLQG